MNTATEPTGGLLITGYRLARRLFRDTPVQRWAVTGRVYRYLAGRAMAGRDRMTLDFHGAVLEVPARDISMCLALKGGSYDAVLTGVLNANLTRDRRFLDVGANIGLYSALAATRVGPEGRVVAVEPMAASRAWLVANLVRNGGAGARVIEAAAGAHNGTLELYVETSSMGTCSAVDRHGEATRVPVVRLDDELGGETFDVVKVDVEGYELSVLGGMPRLLENDPLLALEYSENADAPALRRWLASRYERVWVCDERRRRLVVRRPEELAGQRRVNVLATGHPERYSGLS